MIDLLANDVSKDLNLRWGISNIVTNLAGVITIVFTKLKQTQATMYTWDSYQVMTSLGIVDVILLTQQLNGATWVFIQI